jgi:hypothetical protein
VKFQYSPFQPGGNPNPIHCRLVKPHTPCLSPEKVPNISYHPGELLPGNSRQPGAGEYIQNPYYSREVKPLN